MTKIRPVLTSLGLAACLLACGTDTGVAPGPPGAGDAQNPPGTAAAFDAWIAAGHYKAWACEAGPMDARPNGPHGRNRVCSNKLMQGNTGGEYAVDSAAVKELFDGGGTITGYAVSRHVKAGKTGDTWYWYEKLGSRVAADGVGVPGCIGCHSAAGSDGSHQGHDYVYLQVK